MLFRLNDAHTTYASQVGTLSYSHDFRIVIISQYLQIPNIEAQERVKEIEKKDKVVLNCSYDLEHHRL